MNTKKSSGWSMRKKILITLGVLFLAATGIYIYYATEKYAGTKDIKEDFAVSATQLIHEFRTDAQTANVKYSDKTVLVNGRITELEAPDSTTLNVKFVDEETGDYLIFAFQEQYLAEARSLKEGDSIAIKGNSSGSSYSDLLEAYTIPFKRSTLINNFGNE